MTRIATADMRGTLLSALMTAQARQADAAEQVATQRKATDLKGFGGGSETVAAARSVKARLEALAQSGKAVQAGLDAQDLALGQVEGAASDARSAVFTAVANGDASGLMTGLETALQQAVGALNLGHLGRPMFAGGRGEGPAVRATTLAGLTAAGAPDNLFQTDGFRAAARIDEGVSIETGFLADEVGGPLFDALAEIQAFATGPGGPLTGKLTQAQTDFLTGTLPKLAAATATVTSQLGLNGQRAARAEAAATSIADRSLAADSLLLDMTGVDVAEAYARLQSAQTAVQASAQVYASLKGTSLLDLLR